MLRIDFIGNGADRFFSRRGGKHKEHVLYRPGAPMEDFLCLAIRLWMSKTKLSEWHWFSNVGQLRYLPFVSPRVRSNETPHNSRNTSRTFI